MYYGGVAQKPRARFEVDYGHPLIPYVGFLFSERAGSVARSFGRHILRYRATLEGNARFGGQGVTLDTTGSGGWVNVVEPDDSHYTGNITLIWRGVRRGSSGCQFLGKHTGAGASNNPFDFRSVAGELSLVRGGVLGFGTSQASTLTFPQDELLTVGVRDTAGSIRFYKNGRPEDGNLPINNFGGTTGTGADIRMGLRADLGFQLDGYIEYALIYDKALSDDMIRWLAVEPYAFVRPWPDRRYFVLGVQQLSIFVFDSDEFLPNDPPPMPASGVAYDDMVASEAVVIGIGSPFVGVDAVTPTDAVEIMLWLSIRVEDQLTPSDVVDSGSVTVQPLFVVVSDLEPSADETTLIRPNTFEVSDALTAIEDVRLGFNARAEVEDTLTPEEAVALASGSGVSVVDDLTPTDAAGAELNVLVVAVEDAVVVGELVNAAPPLRISAMDELNAGEVTERAFTTHVFLDDLHFINGQSSRRD